MIAGHEFLAPAERLVHESAEADWRSAVSRASYAAFHEARRLLADLGFRVPHGETRPRLPLDATTQCW